MSDVPEPPQDAEPLWARLRSLWAAADPMPAELPAKVLAAVAVEDLDRDYELMRLLDTAPGLTGVRSCGDPSGDDLRTATIQFTHDRLDVLLRVSALGGQSCRLDGWIAPAIARTVTLRNQDAEYQAPADSSGRFEFESVPVGLHRLWLDGADCSFTTAMFEL